jgi:FtsH-binding integral membrane protein
MKVGLWTAVIGVIILTGVCAYETAVIQHLQFVIQLLSMGRPN